MERTGMSPVRASLSSMEIKDKSMPTYSRLQKPVLVLNASYEPINICAARRALILRNCRSIRCIPLAAPLRSLP
jgi:hypothetical protein